MTSFKDLTQYQYRSHGSETIALNIGWLGDRFDFCIEPPQAGFVHRLWQFCLRPVSQTRGFYECQLCEKPPVGPLIFEYDSQKIKLGTSEIRVFASDGTVYAAPDLILHYVHDHHYHPPQEFVDAVMTSELPVSAEYQTRIEGMGLKIGNTLRILGIHYRSD